jgi:hypothetical protein
VYITRIKARASYHVEAGKTADQLVPLRFEEKQELRTDHYVKISK